MLSQYNKLDNSHGKNFWPLLMLLRNEAIYLRGLNIQLYYTCFEK
jgi:hypothetical protein